MTQYKTVVMIHVLAAVVWVGASLTYALLATRIRATGAGAAELMLTLERLTWWMGRLIMPSILIVLGAGIWLVVDGPWEFSDPFVIAGLAGFGFSAVFNGVLLDPYTKRTKAMVEGGDAESAEVRSRIGRIVRAGQLDALILFAVIALMVAKP